MPAASIVRRSPCGSALPAYAPASRPIRTPRNPWAYASGRPERPPHPPAPMSDSAILGPIAVVGLNPKPGGRRIAAASACSGYMIIYRRRIEETPMVRLRFGCSGWDYQEWIGPVYRNASESKLRGYSRIFATAEINSPFYPAPSPGMVLGRARYTPRDFLFAAKVPQTVTHDPLLALTKG